MAANSSEALERWLQGAGDKTLGSLIDLFEEKSFAVLFVLLLAVPALPLPTGGATHVLVVIAVLLALQLIAGRQEIWLPERWRKREMAGPTQERLLTALMKMIRRLERISKPRLRFLFDHRASNLVFGVLVIAGCVAAFVAPPFTGLDTLPSLAVVLLSLGVLLTDFAIVVAGVLVGVAGVALEIVLGKAAIDALQRPLLRLDDRVSTKYCPPDPPEPLCGDGLDRLLPIREDHEPHHLAVAELEDVRPLLVDLNAAALAPAVVTRENDHVIAELEVVVRLDPPVLPLAEPAAEARIRGPDGPRRRRQGRGTRLTSPTPCEVVDVEAGLPVATAPLLVDRSDQVGVAGGIGDHATGGSLISARRVDAI